MSEEKPLPRDTFDAIVNGCMTVLERHGFTPQPIPQTNSQFSGIFEDVCFGWFGDVTPKPKPKNPPLPLPKRTTNLTQKQMNQMTLECALIFAQENVEGVHYNESLSHIRLSIINVFRAMGYDIPAGILGSPGWGCYKLWEEVARRNGLEDQKIAEIRKWFKENQPEHYEAA